MKLKTKVKAVFDYTLNILLYLASVLLFVAFVIVCAEVIMRYFFNLPQVWEVEITEYILLYVTFLTAPWLLREEEHVKMDVFLNLLRPRSQRVVNAITSLLCAIVCLVLVVYGTWNTVSDYREGILTYTALEIAKWPILIVIPFGSCFLFIQFVRRAYGYWERDKSREISNH